MSLVPTFAYRTEEECKIYLKRYRETVGIVCKNCCQQSHRWIQHKSLWHCRNCSFRTTLKSGTLFESTKLPLSKWFLALRLMCNNKKGISACEMRRQLGLKRYEPVWYMMHKIRLAMKNYNSSKSNSFEIMTGEMALTRCTAIRKGATYKSRNSAPLHLLSNIECNTDLAASGGIKLQISCFENLDGYQFNDQANSRGSIAFDLRNSRAKKIRQPRGLIFADVDSTIRSNGVFKWWISKSLINLHRILNGIHHTVSKKHMQLHLDEFSFKFNHRYRSDLDNFLFINSLNRPG